MRLSGVHILLTYVCTFECDHCFVWGSPWQRGTMTLDQIDEILDQAFDLGTVKWIYFEGGEPFLYQPVLARGVELAEARGFSVGIVSNGYWATCERDAMEWLSPFAGRIRMLSISNDAYHAEGEGDGPARAALAAGEKLGIPVEMIAIAEPEGTGAVTATGQLPAGESAVMYRGRAAEKLVERVNGQSWTRFTECPRENLRDPERVHVDPVGDVHVCQGMSAGNLFRTPLKEICAAYDPEAHPIIGPLLRGGPAGLVRQFGLAHRERYADACHLCDDARRILRARFPESLGPDQMYGVPEN
jgi:MoaA/NifB/PqqE/SkfB family radical SAM enzyme